MIKWQFTCMRLCPQQLMGALATEDIATYLSFRGCLPRSAVANGGSSVHVRTHGLKPVRARHSTYVPQRPGCPLNVSKLTSGWTTGTVGAGALCLVPRTQWSGGCHGQSTTWTLIHTYVRTGVVRITCVEVVRSDVHTYGSQK